MTTKTCCGSNGPRHKKDCSGEQPVAPIVTPQYTEEQLKSIGEGVSGASVPTVEETLKMTTRVNGDAVTQSGIIIPSAVLARMSSDQFTFVVEYTQSEAVVSKFNKAGRKLFVRTYTREVHGEAWKKMAEQFVQKNNRSAR